MTVQMKPLLHYCHIMLFLFSAFYGMNLGKFSRILTLTNFGSEQGGNQSSIELSVIPHEMNGMRAENSLKLLCST